jgi:diphosphomevalonate decarboxylase
MIKVRAPSNIALAKYMGKTDGGKNIPSNASLSMTLNSLCTFAEVRETNGGLSWSNEKLVLDDKGRERIFRHIERVWSLVPAVLEAHKLEVKVPPGLELCASNTFPTASGIASSASSFAAFTLAATAAACADLAAFKKAWRNDSALRAELAKISRQGSGSSCRSFDGPWILWNGEETQPVPSRLPEISDLVVVVSSATKEVSSSEAHRRVTTSPLWNGRVERANQRTEILRAAISAGDWNEVARQAWAECWEMHSLFHTSQPPFTYFQPGTIAVLRWLSSAVASPNPPIVTLDAGPNVHVLVPSAEVDQWLTKLNEAFPEYQVLKDTQGFGAELL